MFWCGTSEKYKVLVSNYLLRFFLTTKHDFEFLYFLKKVTSRVKGYCPDREIFTLLRCTTEELFFSCCGSVAAHFKHAATRLPRRKLTAETCVKNTSKLRLKESVLAIRATGANQLLKPAPTKP